MTFGIRSSVMDTIAPGSKSWPASCISTNACDSPDLLTVDELLDLYAHSDLMVLASGVTRDSHEGFGIVYLEAAASGVPSLAARSAAPRKPSTRDGQGCTWKSHGRRHHRRTGSASSADSFASTRKSAETSRGIYLGEGRGSFIAVLFPAALNREMQG